MGTQSSLLIMITLSMPLGGMVSSPKKMSSFFIQQKSDNKEIAKMLDIDINTSKSQYSRARSLLQKQLDKIVYDTNFG